MSPLAHALPMWSGLQVRSTTTSSRDHAWIWQQQRDPHTKMKFISLGYAYIVPRGQSKLGLCGYARLDMMRLVSYPGVLDQCLSFTGAAKLTRASFPVLVLQAAKLCWDKNGQGKSLRHCIKNTICSIVSQACVACKATPNHLLASINEAIYPSTSANLRR